MNLLFFYPTKVSLWPPVRLVGQVPKQIEIPARSRVHIEMIGMAFDGTLIADLEYGENRHAIHIHLPHNGDINVVNDDDRLNSGYQPYEPLKVVLALVE